MTYTLSMLELDSPIGTLQLVGTDAVLTGCFLPELPAPAGLARGETPVLARAAAQLAEYFAGRRTSFELPLGAQGTEFQARVWRALATIPYGETWSYAMLARAIGQPSASRAVGAANGKNPLGIIVPCHRVIGADRSLTGYAGGLAAKRWLLAHEQAVVGTARASC